MTRRVGARNKDYERRQIELAGLIRARLATSAKQPSYADLASAAGVSLATLRHYFGTRDQAVAAVFELHGPLGNPYLNVLRQPSGPFAQSVRAAADFISLGLAQPTVAELHSAGLSEGIGHVATGPAYLRNILEPMTMALEDRFATHIAAGEMRTGNPKIAALALISPLLIAHLHQRALGGTETRPLDQDAFRRNIVQAFVRGFAV